jgi:hypothetical protein
MRKNHGRSFCRSACYVSPFILHGDYAKYLAPWLAAFPRQQVPVLDYQAINDEPASVLRGLSRFLGIDPTFAFDTGTILNSRENRYELSFYLLACTDSHRASFKCVRGPLKCPFSFLFLFLSRGVHGADSTAKIGGIMSAIDKGAVGDTSWSSKVEPYAAMILQVSAMWRHRSHLRSRCHHP